VGQSFQRLIALFVFVVVTCTLSFGQVSATAPISGSVTDPNGAVIAGAAVNVKNPTTGTEFNATTNDSGSFTIPAVESGVYTIRITAAGFKAAVVKDFKVNVGTPASVNVTLQVGVQTEEIQVSGGSEVLQTQSPTVNNTLTGRQITDLPLSTRNSLELVLFLPGTSTGGVTRNATINGLPKGALNISLDGINVQDNLLKSNDGFFTYIQPKLDAIDEVTVSTAASGADSNGEGGAQIKFVTRSGNNAFNGSVYEYLRNPSLNANNYFNNLNGLPRNRVLLNQFGVRVGGPIIKDRAFFFVNYEEYRLPEQIARQKTILTADAQAGIFKYDTPDPSNPNLTIRHTANLFQLAAAHGLTGFDTTVDPTINTLLTQIRSSTSQGAVKASSDPNYQVFNFINSGAQIRKFPTVRFDINLTSKHHLENSYNYQQFGSKVDFLNASDPAFPGFPNFGSQGSNRFSNSTGLRSTITQNIVNEARFGLTGGTVRFFPEVTPAQFANQGGFDLSLAGAGISNATVQSFPQKRNSPVFTFTDNLSWTRGNHGLTFGFEWTQISLFSSFPSGGVVSTVGFDVDAADRASAIFDDPFFGPTSDAQFFQAIGIYALLTGRVTSVSGTAILDENTNKYKNLGNYVERDRQRQFGLFAQDSWKYRPNLTLTGGLRWEAQLPFVPTNNNYAQTTEAGLFGISGLGNVFKPGTQSGGPTSFVGFKAGDQAYNTQWGNFAPTIGFAWSPNFKEGWLRKFGGESGQTVIRGGYSMSFVREGTNVVSSILGANPGGTLDTSRSLALGNFPATPVFFRSGVPALVTPPASPAYPIVFGKTATDFDGLGQTANAFIPDLKTGRVHSWSFGIQREINKDTVVEFRYVANRAMDLWRQYSINETNIVENGFLSEFKLAQNNLAANVAAGKGNTFAFTGAPGTSPLPIIFGLFVGGCPAPATPACPNPAAKFNDPANYTSPFFANSTFRARLNPLIPNALGFANTILGNPGLFLANQAAAGLPANLFVANPGVSSDAIGGGSFIVDNSNRSYYDALVIEVRRRLAHGLLFQGSYTFSKTLSNSYSNDSAVFKRFISLHNPGLDRGISPFDVAHAVKANFIYELPVGKGRRFLDGANGVVDRVVGGWSFNGTVRIQSGTPFSLGNVQLVGMSRQELQHEVGIRHDVIRNLTTGQPVLDPVTGRPTAVVLYLPFDIIQNSFRASSGNAPATGRYIAPANLGQALAFPGQRGFSNLVLHGPAFKKFDLSFVKKTKITERVNFEFRAELLDAFNNSNLRVTPATTTVGTVTGIASQAFGQTTNAFADLNGSNDPGGRLIQFVARINF